MPMLPEDARYGAAYQIMFERFDPDNCISLERLARVREIAQATLAWAATKEPDVRVAYQRAIHELVKRAEARFENNMRISQLLAAKKDLPIPP